MRFDSDKLKRLRVENGFSQYELGQKIGVRGQAIAAYENGVNSPRGIHWLKIAQELNVDTYDLLESGV